MILSSFEERLSFCLSHKGTTKFLLLRQQHKGKVWLVFVYTYLRWQIHWSLQPGQGRRWRPLECGKSPPPAAGSPPYRSLWWHPGKAMKVTHSSKKSKVQRDEMNLAWNAIFHYTVTHTHKHTNTHTHTKLHWVSLLKLVSDIIKHKLHLQSFSFR